MEPILTLCHHGSGPHYTNLLDDGFAPGLARHAAAVAQRYPWVEDYTPVNEPLTTARFSALYGFWYPHARDERAFWTTLLNEIDATRLAMREIRRVNPAARLVQTDDLGFCHASEPLQHEADFQNERRWMGWDMLCGMVLPGHTLWDRLCASGLGDRLRAIADDPCPPDIIGVNHYLSSERLLDHRVELHAGRALADERLGECGGVVHVDVDAARNLPDRVIGLSGLVEQAWERYRIPVAITECHYGATREEQARWFIEAWENAGGLRRRGVDVRAVTAWALLGSYDWNRMVTRCAGHYEPGIFDVRGSEPRPTLMAHVLPSLARGEKVHLPPLQVPGWWRNERRTCSVHAPGRFRFKLGPTATPQPAPLMIIDDGGMLARTAVQACEERGLHHYIVQSLDARQLQLARPWAVFDCRRPADDPTATAEQLSYFCAALAVRGALFVDAERLVALRPQRAILAAQIGSTFAADDEAALAVRVFRACGSKKTIAVESNRRWNETYAPSVFDGVLDMLLDGAAGLVPFVPAEQWSEATFARKFAELSGGDPDLVLVRGDTSLRNPVAAGVSCLPPAESMLERLLRDLRNQPCTCARKQIEDGILTQAQAAE